MRPFSADAPGGYSRGPTPRSTSESGCACAPVPNGDVMTPDTAERQPADGAFPARGDPAERLRFLLSWAVLAPSRHNTQPWLFEIEGDEVRLYADASRALHTTDPD